MTYYIRDPKRDHYFDNRPHGYLLFWDAGAVGPRGSEFGCFPGVSGFFGLRVSEVCG